VNHVAVTTTHPQRQPWSAQPRYIDGKTPIWEFFDRVQDHLGVFYHAATGHGWSAAREDFERPVQRTLGGRTFIGDFRVTDNQNLDGVAGLIVSDAGAAEQGDHGVAAFLSGARGWSFSMRSSDCNLGSADYLICAKVRIVNRAILDPVGDGGFRLAAGPVIDAFGLTYPAFLAGGDSPNWYISTALVAEGPPVLFDTGVPLYDSSSGKPYAPWYTLQIARTALAVRFFINGALVRVSGLEGVYLAEGLREMRRVLSTRSWRPGVANQGFFIDYFHRLCKR